MLQRSLWINPFYSGPYILLGRAYMKKGRPRPPRACCGAPSSTTRTTASAHYLLAQLLQQIGPPRGSQGGVRDRRKAAGAARAMNARAILRGVALAAFTSVAAWSARRLADAALARTADRRRRARRSHVSVDLRRRRSQAIHHRDQRRRRRARRLRPRRLARRARAERHAPRGRRSGAMRRFGPGEAPANRLYRNQRDGTFADVTDRVGLRRTGWASGVCAGDYDSDGWLGPVPHLLRPERALPQRPRRPVPGRHRGRRACAARDVRWGSGCTFIDYDRDGRLDLFVSNYLRFDLEAAAEPGKGPNCLWKGVPVNCGPKGLPTDTNLLFRNRGNGMFEDVSVGIRRRARDRPVSDDRGGGGSGRRRLARHLRRLRFHRRHPLPQQPGWHVHGRGARKRRGVQRSGEPAGGHGPGRRRRQHRWPSRSPEDAFRRRHPGAVSRPRRVDCSRMWPRRPGWAFRTGTWSGARGCPISTTTAGPTSCM